MTAQEKRISLAKDVIAQLEAKCITAMNSQYCNIQFAEELDETLQVNQVLDKVTSCDVCLKGALFITDVINRNHCTIGEVGNEKVSWNRVISKRFADVFTQDQLDLMEVAFEGDIVQEGDYLGTWIEPTDIGQAALDFYDSNKNPDIMIIEILQNLIENDGEFIP